MKNQMIPFSLFIYLSHNSLQMRIRYDIKTHNKYIHTYEI